MVAMQKYNIHNAAVQHGQNALEGLYYHHYIITKLCETTNLQESHYTCFRVLHQGEREKAKL